MNPLQALEEQQARESAALTMKQERTRSLAVIVYPSRKTNEMNAVYKMAVAASKALEIYDLSANPPPLADLTSQQFNECVAQLVLLVTPKEAKQ